ncbi:unnamed protein product [Acanthosepion pharaonis]|uniref:Uncharacterized protein n=1 Tax=Acanthosepion pharaonis TaxID=158019 RepID=A0A812DUA1_ACAPH|nr:unnamed protein product [Sepia pharaonis]
MFCFPLPTHYFSISFPSFFLLPLPIYLISCSFFLNLVSAVFFFFNLNYSPFISSLSSLYLIFLYFSFSLPPKRTNHSHFGLIISLLSSPSLCDIPIFPSITSHCLFFLNLLSIPHIILSPPIAVFLLFLLQYFFHIFRIPSLFFSSSIPSLIIFINLLFRS